MYKFNRGRTMKIKGVLSLLVSFFLFTMVFYNIYEFSLSRVKGNYIAAFASVVLALILIVLLICEAYIYTKGKDDEI